MIRWTHWPDDADLGRLELYPFDGSRARNSLPYQGTGSPLGRISMSGNRG